MTEYIEKFCESDAFSICALASAHSNRKACPLGVPTISYYDVVLGDCHEGGPACHAPSGLLKSDDGLSLLRADPRCRSNTTANDIQTTGALLG